MMTISWYFSQPFGFVQEKEFIQPFSVTGEKRLFCLLLDEICS